jgi:hypothetical protein
MHYERQRKGRPVGTAERLRRPPGEGHVSKHGYVLITVDGRTVLEHRHLMEKLLGRPLARHESVHHVNGDRSDNRTAGPLVNGRSGNLELWSSYQPPGQRIADKLAFARDIFERYAPDIAVALGWDLDPETGLPLAQENSP